MKGWLMLWNILVKTLPVSLHRLPERIMTGRVMFVAVAAGGELADGAWEEPWRPPPHHGWWVHHHHHHPTSPPWPMVGAPPPWKPGAACLDNHQPSWERLQKQRPPLPLEDNHHHHLQQENPNLLHLGSLGSLEHPHHKQPLAKPIKGNPEKI